MTERGMEKVAVSYDALSKDIAELMRDLERSVKNARELYRMAERMTREPVEKKYPLRRTCEECEGTGSVVVGETPNIATGDIDQIMGACPICGGKGTI